MIRQLQKKFSKYEPLVHVIIKQKNILHNFREFQKGTPSIRIAPVLKSNAYGHGLLEIANILTKEPIAFFVVDSLYEANIMRRNGIKNPLLVIGYTSGKNIAVHTDGGIAFTVTSIEHLKSIAASTKKHTAIHLKIDTGMHRQGLYPQELQEAKDIITQYPHLLVEGICTHLADADSPDEIFTEKQINLWNETYKNAIRLFPGITHAHVSATSGERFADRISANVMRLGIGLYGIDPSPKISQKNTRNLMPALELLTKISSIKSIQSDAKVGYNGTFTAEKQMRIATIPVGYFEGIDRRLSNLGGVRIQGKDAKIVGRVSMNMTTIDVTDLPFLEIEEPVTVISSHPEDQNSINQIAKICGCIPYEILVHIPQHLRRIVVE